MIGSFILQIELECGRGPLIRKDCNTRTRRITTKIVMSSTTLLKHKSFETGQRPESRKTLEAGPGSQCLAFYEGFAAALCVCWRLLTAAATILEQVVERPASTADQRPDSRTLASTRDRADTSTYRRRSRDGKNEILC
jgi:hypothetical protein